MANINNQFTSLVGSDDFVFAVFFRGHWCPFCMQYLTTLQSLLPAITNNPGHSGAVVVITSEPAIHLPATLKSTGYSGNVIVDERNVLAEEFRKRGWVDVAISEKKGYEHGMAQPAVLVISKGEVLEKWAIVPGVMNLGGAKDRPELEQIWENVKAKLNGEKAVYSKYRLSSFVGMLKSKIFG